MDAPTPTATVPDCMDISRWQTYSVKKGQVLPMPTEQPLRYVATAPTQKWEDGRLTVMKAVYRNQPQAGRHPYN
ncbi:hypothetical protein ACIOGT_39595 [Streptomyces microflavus]|uniref:hypothetical protein n=1 Tax=Streptomyces microflavus TaxID=1919 RepID=UPI00382405A2